MSIRIDVLPKHEERAKKLGACLLPDGKTWVIPDEVKSLNPFKRWLPDGEGFYVKRPYFVARAKMPCYKCKKETPVVALGARIAQEAAYIRGDSVTWRKWDLPTLFHDVTYLDEEVAKSMQENYPYFKLKYSKRDREKIWGNTCIHCGTMLDTHDEFKYEAHALSPLTVEEAMEIRVIYFKLEFDYYIQACGCMDPLIVEVLGWGEG